MSRVALFLLATFVAIPANAQRSTAEEDSCFASIPIGLFTRVPVIVQADADRRGVSLLPSADVFAQAVAVKLRVILGGNESQLPKADSAILLSRLNGEMIVTAHRNKPVTWQMPAWYPSGSDTAPKSALALLSRAIKAVIADGEAIVMTDEFKGDSISFWLRFIHPDVAPNGNGTNLVAREGEPAFTLLVPWGKPVEGFRSPSLRYPDVARGFPHIQSIRLTYTVDKSGRPIPASARELWPYTGPIPRGPGLFAYEALARTIRKNLDLVGYSPALLGGCAVEQVITQEFKFAEPVERIERR